MEPSNVRMDAFRKRKETKAKMNGLMKETSNGDNE
jgi:hypothetical protein